MSEYEMPCIRCGACSSICPVRLQPQQLLFDLRSGRLASAEQHGLFNCSECGLCDLACPSRITLVARFQLGKAAVRQADSSRQQAMAARERFETRNARLLREAVERAEREATLTAQAASTDAVAAAIERAKARRQTRDQP